MAAAAQTASISCASATAEDGYVLSSMYVKKLRAPPRAPRLTKRMTSTQSFMSFGVGRASGSMRNVSRMRMSVCEW